MWKAPNVVVLFCRLVYINGNLCPDQGTSTGLKMIFGLFSLSVFYILSNHVHDNEAEQCFVASSIAEACGGSMFGTSCLFRSLRNDNQILTIIFVS